MDIVKELDKLSKQCLETAMRRGQVTESTTYHDFTHSLMDELYERIEAIQEDRVLEGSIAEVSQKEIHNSYGDELADIILICLSEFEWLDMSAGEYIMNKINFNKERD